MESAVSILMFCFSGAILLYALVLAVTKKVILIDFSDEEDFENPKEFATRFAKIMALVGLSPAVGGAVGLFAGSGACLITTLVALIVTIAIGTKMIK